MNNKKLKLVVVLFFVGLAGIIYSVYNTSGYTSEKDDTNNIFDNALVGNAHVQIQTEDSKDGKVDKDDVMESPPANENYAEVYVCGCVNKPGVYKLKSGSRLYEYLELAGGYTKEADRDYENLARVMWDGEKVYFPSNEETKDNMWVSDDTSNDNKPNENVSDSNKKVNINTADIGELTSLTGIGESRAKSIIAYRQENGPFECIEDIMLVSGIKESLFGKIKEQITV